MTDEAKNTFDAWASVFTILAALVAAVWTLIEYHYSKDEARVQKTLTFYQYSVDREYFIAEALEVGSGTLERTRVAQNKAASDATKDPAIWTKYVIEFVNGNEAFRVAVLNVIAFNESILTCVSGNLCDKDTAIQLFGQSAREYWNSLFPWIYCTRTIQKTPPKFAIGMEFLAIEAASIGKTSSERRAIKARVETAKVECPTNWQTLGLETTKSVAP
jgi:hypothetical protein